MTTEITVFKAAQYPILDPENIEGLKDVFEDAMGGESISKRQLFTRIPTPGGGGTTFSFDTLTGPIEKKEISGVIVHIQPERALFEGEYGKGGDTFPICSSQDGIDGIGEPGGICDNCPENEFGDDGEAKNCKESKGIFILTKDDLLPMAIYAGPGSFDALKKYRIGLLRSGLKMQNVETGITLEKAVNKKGISFSRLVFKLNNKVSSKEDISAIAHVKDSLMPMLAGDCQLKNAA